MGTKMKRFFARFAIVMALVSLASAAPIPAGDVLGASGSVAGEYTGNIPSVETGAPVPPRKRFRFASPIATYSDPHKTAWTQDSIETIFEPPPKKIRLTLSDEASGGVEQRSTAAIPSGGEITAALPKKSILKAPSRLRSKSPYPSGRGQQRSWLPSWRWPEFWGSSAKTRELTIGRKNRRTKARYRARNPNLAPKLLRQNTELGREVAVPNHSWLQRMTEGARGFLEKAAAPFKYFHGA